MDWNCDAPEVLLELRVTKIIQTKFVTSVTRPSLYDT